MTCSEEFLDDKKIDFLSATFILLHQVCSGYSEDFKKKIYFFLNLEDKGEEPAGFPSTDEKLKALQRNLSASDVRAVFLDRFYMVNREHIENWIENYFTKDEEAKDELFDVHFAGLPPSFRMRHAEKSIRQLFKRIREHDPAIINIFNK